MSNPWKLLHSKVVYRNRYWQARESQVIKPDGERGIYCTVERCNFSIMIPLTKDRRSTFLIRQWRFPTNKPLWEFSAGLIDGNETPRQAARRELEEETGWRAKKLHYAGFGYTSPGLTNQKFHIYIAENLEQGQQRLEGSEADMVVKRITLGKVKRMIKRGEIADAASIVAFHHLELFLQK